MMFNTDSFIYLFQILNDTYLALFGKTQDNFANHCRL